MNNIIISIFNNTQNSYKFFWWLAILEIVQREQKNSISFEEIVFVILARIWYPVNYYKLSFGKQDQLSKHVLRIKEYYKLRDDIKENDLIAFLKKNKSDKLLQEIVNSVIRYVPYRFLRSWFSSETRGIIDSQVNDKVLQLQDSKINEIPYTINPDKGIAINEEYLVWIKSNFKLIEAFTLYELLLYFEKNNPNVSNLSIKLFKPENRRLSIATALWKDFIQQDVSLTDIFEHKQLQKIDVLSIDHFLPWSFVTHDQIWNLHPIEKNVNSSKSNCLPSYKYLGDFIYLQFEFSRFLIFQRNQKVLEDYHQILKTNSTEFKIISFEKFRNKLRDYYLPQFETAINMGFEKDWIYN
jgi:hypothetical protein